MEAETVSESQLAEKNKVDADISAKASPEAQTSTKKTHRYLKARSKALKKSNANNSFMAKKAKGSISVEGTGKRKIKKVVHTERDNIQIENEDGNSENFREVNIRKNFAEDKLIEKDQEIQTYQDEITGSTKEQKKKHQKDKHDEQAKSLRDRNSSGNLDGRDKVHQHVKKKEKLGGLIFMCSAKTKPDCFRYRIMGVSMNKKDLVLGVKPGLKLFLYDFDLKLMYGIYEASSSGGVKLEPKAFGGAFPVQVRFNVYKDCFPIAESVFKKAIKDNYNKNNKFDTELTVRQVRKLSQLFRPAVLQSAPGRSPVVATIPDRKARESHVHSDREAFSRVNHDGWSYPVRSHERDRSIEYRDVGSVRREDIPCDLFMSEREYRTYGLKGQRRRLTPPLVTSTLDPYERDRERERLRQPDPIYRDVPAQREAVLVNPHYLAQRELHTYHPTIGRELPPAASLIAASASSSAPTSMDLYTRDTREPYYAYVNGSSYVDAYLPASRREEISSGSYYTDGRRGAYLVEADLPRGREMEVDELYSKYSDVPSSYNQLRYYPAANSETVPPSVSSWYSFASPSFSHRLS